MHTYVYISGDKNISFFGSFCICTSRWFLTPAQSTPLITATLPLNLNVDGILLFHIATKGTGLA